MNISIVGPVNSLGYGQACVNLMLSLDRLGHKISYFPVAGLNTVEPPLGTENKIREFYLNGEMFDPTAPCLKIWHQFDMSFRVGRGKFYAYPFFELDTFTDREKHHLGHADGIIVTCQWAKEVVQRNLPDYKGDIYIIPLGVDNKIFKPSENTRKTTVFFTAGKWEIRKGHDILCEAFNTAFTPDDNVELQLLCNNPFLNKEQTEKWVNLYTGSKMGRNIKILPRVESHYDVARLMRGADCGVFLSRAEGWNLELLEMMACGKRVIATNCTAHKEFCTSTNSLLIDTYGVEPAYDGIWFNGKVGNWSKLTSESVQRIVSYMRAVHQDKMNGLNMTNIEGIATAEQFTWDNAARKLVGCINGNFGVLS